MISLKALQTVSLAPAATTNAVSLWLATALMCAGVAVHFVQTMAELEDSGQHFTPIGYLRLHPWRAAALVSSSWGLLYVCFATGELTKVTAFLIGYACQSAADTLRARANAKTSA